MKRLLILLCLPLVWLLAWLSGFGEKPDKHA